MKRYIFLIVGAILLLPQFYLFAINNSGSLEYRVKIEEPHTHYFDVEIILKNATGKYVDFKMPVWTPGSYLVREYAGNVEGFKATTLKNKSNLEFEKLNKSTWRVLLKGTEDIAIRYKVYAFSGSTRMSFLNEEHAFIMANTLLMYIDELRSDSSILRLEYPDDWSSISTSLTEIEGAEHSFYVPDYDILVDSPIEIGNHEIIRFDAAGVAHEVAMVGKVRFDRDQLVRDLRQIVESATRIFEDNPNEKYTFIIHTDKRSGGLEHSNSTVLGVDRWSFTDQGKYLSFLSLVAHEYFHLWMVKRLKPVELLQVDYEKEVYTDLLWVMEGFTEYYEKKIMLDCGFISSEKFINDLLKQMEVLHNLPGSEVQAVADASFDTWIKYYRRNANSDNSQVSYYQKGQVLAALLDLQIIAGSQGAKSLDDVISQLYYQFYKKKFKGIETEDLKKACERAGGVNLNVFFSDYVNGTKPLDNAKYLDFAGIILKETGKYNGHKSLGLSLSEQQGKLVVTGVKRGGAAYHYGLNVGDELISIDEFRVDSRNYQTILNSYKEGENIKILIARQGLVQEKEMVVRYEDALHYAYELQKSRSKLQIKTYNKWMGK